VADALWELSGQYGVGVWYECERVDMWVNQYDVFCGVVVNGVELDQPQCRTVDECVRQILEDYKNEVEKLRTPPPPGRQQHIFRICIIARLPPEAPRFYTNSPTPSDSIHSCRHIRPKETP
jgi:hypothetical protein